MRVCCKKVSQRRRGTVTQRTSTIIYRQISNWTLWFYSISEKSNKGCEKLLKEAKKPREKKRLENLIKGTDRELLKLTNRTSQILKIANRMRRQLDSIIWGLIFEINDTTKKRTAPLFFFPKWTNEAGHSFMTIVTILVILETYDFRTD
jgi:hypothetical protein